MSKADDEIRRLVRDNESARSNWQRGIVRRILRPIRDRLPTPTGGPPGDSEKKDRAERDQ